MKFGIFTSMGSHDWDGIRQLWLDVEEMGWDIACVTDHFMPNTAARSGPVNEGWSTLSALAALVPRIQVGTIVLGNTYRHPAVLAKMAAQVDIISGGRLLLGLGAGWQENEHTAYGLPFYTVGERLARLDEACEVLLSLWTKERSNYDGKFYQLDDAPLDPKPIQSPHPELMIGGGGERVTLKIVAKHADHWNVWGGPRILAHKGAILDQHCETIGRDPDSLSRSANMALLMSDDKSACEAMVAGVSQRMRRTPEDAADICLAGSDQALVDRLSELAASGVDTLFVPTMFRPVEEMRDDLARLISDIAPKIGD
tara:strand:+ start:907 stop:1845 length:939 start_codon:yes stop_codon:yes gene_type:complete